MSKATFTFGRFNPPTEQGHGKLVKAVQDHAESTGGTHYIFPTRTQDPKKNPMSHEEKVGAMRKLFPEANVISHEKVRTAIDAMKHLESKGHTHVTMIVGSDRVAEFQGLLTKYRKKEFPGIKKVEVKSAGHRDPDAEGAEGMSASKLRGLVAAGKKDEFVSHYSDKKLGKQIHDTVKAGMQMESINPIGIFLLGAPGSGKDYVLNNIFSRFDLTEVQADQILNQSANELYESKTNLVINGALDESRIAKIQDMLHEHGYTYDFVYVSVTNKVSRLRNEQRENPIQENKRIDKFLKTEKLAAFVEAHVFNNSINLNESSEMEKVFFASEIQKLLERVISLGLEMKEIEKKDEPRPKSLTEIKKATGDLKNACWKGYTAIGMKTKNGKKVPNCVPVKEEEELQEELPKKLRRLPRKGNRTKVLAARENNISEMQLVGTDEYKKHAIAMTPGQEQEIETPLETDCGCGGDCQCNETAAYAKKDFRSLRKETVDGVDVTPTLKPKKTKSKPPSPDRLNMTVDGLPITSVFTREEKLREAVEYHLENKISFTENVFRPGSDMFFEMINEAKRLYAEGQYTPADEWEADMLNSDIGETAIYEGREVILDYPFEEDMEQIDEVFNTVYPHTYHGTLRPEDPKSENGPEHLYTFRIPGKGNLQHTYSVSINRFQGKKGSLSFGYHGKKPADFVPVGKHGDRKYFEAGEHEITGEGGGKASSIISTVKSIAQKHAKKHGLKTMVFAGSSDEPSRSKLYNRIVNRMGGKEHRSDDDEFDPYREYSVPMKEESDPTDGKGIGKPWREGGGAVYVRTGDGGVKKVRFSQSGMAKKFNDPARVRSFVARHRCLTNKDKTSASYWACRWPRFFSNSGKTWW